MLKSKMKLNRVAVGSVVQLLATIVFAVGFFPYKPFIPGQNTFTTSEVAKNTESPFDKVIFVVVDALRSDFVYSENSGFAFVQSLIRAGHAIPFTAHASSPTITMPKVKAMTTGSVPSFLDVILNFAESDTTSTLAYTDTWLGQLRQIPNSKLLMYGDDTWLKLFPGFFERADGTSSFFVSDFTEVDNNVTRHIKTELENTDWNGWFMHYLGLDHIGHKAGPHSPHMLPKQREMDSIIKRIYKELLSKEHFSSTLLILCGDHGMNDAGNHGGAAPGETSPALVLMSPKFEAISDTRSAPVLPSSDFNYYDVVEQSDIAATVSALLGLPLPLNNLGIIIPNILKLWSRKTDRMNLLEQNFRQIHDILQRSVDAEIFTEKSLLGVNCTLALTSIDHIKCGVMAQSESFGTYDIRMEAMYKYLRTSQSLLSTAASNYDMRKLCFGIALAAVSFFIHLFTLSASKISIADLSGYGFALLIIFSYGIMMFASSFVEEEHQYWYWMSSLLGVYTFILRPTKRALSAQSILLCVSFLSVARLIRRWNQTGQKLAGSPDIVRNYLRTHCEVLWIACVITILYFGLRLAYCKQTHFFVQPVRWLTFALMFSTTAFKVCFTSADSPELLGGMAKYVTSLSYYISLVNQARFIFMLLGALCVQLFLNSTREAAGPERRGGAFRYLLAFFLITEIRVTNIPLLLLQEALFMVMSREVFSTKEWSAIELGTISVVLQHMSFFAFGGTNAISSIDLSNAYNGVSGYNVLAVGTLTFVSNWVGPIWWATACVSFLLGSRRIDYALFHYLHTTSLFFSGALLFTMLACTFLRAHLFIWTVFSPKYLYCMAWSIVQHTLINFMYTCLLYCWGTV